MSSRFISSGKIDAKTGEAVAPSASDTNPAEETRSKGGAEWEIVQKELDAERRRREEARVKAVEGGERTAKEAAFEEANKIRNQFRALDDDEIDFLDEVREKQRVEEEKVREETTEGLRSFRERQKVQDRTPVEEESKQGDGASDEWAVGRKRKRERGGEVKGLVKRRVSEGGKGEGRTRDGGKAVPATTAARSTVTNTAAVAAEPTSVSPPPPKLGLVAYDSDDDE
ncbi:hypothetical protein ACHAQH_002623 [Verticillium albo-atrum]